MKLYDNWREIVRQAWSVRFIVLAAILSGCEAILPLYWDSMPRQVFALLAFGFCAAAFTARLVAQKGL